MPDRTAAVLAHVERLNGDVCSVTDDLTLDEWHTTTTTERWPVGYAVRHIATATRRFWTG
jgi:hypothetical protein